MYQVALEKKISPRIANKTINEIFGRTIQRGKLIILAREPDTVEPYPEDIQAYHSKDEITAISLSDYMKKRGLTA